MKRKYRTTMYILTISLILTIIPLSLASGQGKKNEEKIKIVIADDSGKKVVVDTLINEEQVPDTLRLKDGKVIFIGHHGNETDMKSPSEKEYVYVTISSDGKKTKKEYKNFTVINDDSINWASAGNKHHRFIYMNNDKLQGGNCDNQIDAENSSDNQDTTIDKTRFIIAKNGIVVTIEGNNEAKTKELIQLVQDKLGIKNEVSADEAVKKTGTKSEIKK